MRLLNIGCGDTYHTDWVNIDIAGKGPDVITHDLKKGLPFPDSSFDVCYSSHLLEHFAIKEAETLIKECFRVLKPNGIVRIAVPDIEVIVKKYLQLLEELESGNFENENDYDWIMLEMVDQMVRSKSGGEMGRYLSSPDIPNKEFILSRIGQEAEIFWESNQIHSSKSLIKKLKSEKISWFINKLRIILAGALVWLIGGKEAYVAFNEGLFHKSGEIHKWMYDRFSLGRLLKRSGFINVTVCLPHESSIQDFNNYHLDITGGHVRKPDSLFMEGVKP
jgi:predicted SAM-dependent methyltransferase